MSKREVAELACRILAVTILALSVFRIIVVPVQIVMGLYDVMRGYRSTGTGFTLLGGSVSAVLHLALVCFLWTRSDWIARKIVPQESGTDVRWPRFRVKDFQVAAFSTVGMVMFIYGVGYFCHSLGVWWRYGWLNAPPRTLSTWLSMDWTLASLAYMALGAWLIVGSRKIVRFIRLLRKPEFHEDDEVAETGGAEHPAAESDKSLSASVTNRETT
jgi:hypothetical protein